MKLTLKTCQEASHLLNPSRQNILPMNPTTPLLYCLPKIHKPNCPVRPIVSFTGSPASKLSHMFSTFLPSCLKFESTFSIKNSLELSSRLVNFTIPSDCMLVSFDVVNLFPSIPPDECLEIVRQLLFEKSGLHTHVILDLCTLLDLVLKQNFFQFENKYYCQVDGLSMGSSISPFLSEAFMSKFEQNLSRTSLFLKHILKWYRYVDDVFAIFRGTHGQLMSFLDLLNSLHPSIKFTCELEVNDRLPFLDLIIERDNCSLNFDIFRKPTTTDSVIPFTSNHPYSQKFSSFHSMFHRLFNIPLSPSNFQKELSIIRQIAEGNGYPERAIERIYRRHMNRQLNKSLTDGIQQKTYRSLRFFGQISVSIAKLFSAHTENTLITFKTVNTLAKHLINTKDKIPITQRSGVYQLFCSQPQCNVTYVGQSGRRIETRVGEHLKHIEKNRDKDIVNTPSQFANHILESGHTFDPRTGVKVLHVCEKSLQLDLLEILEINRALRSQEYNCVNEQINFDCSTFFNSIREHLMMASYLAEMHSA
ncbi:uncharacterized protein LOC123312368 isoform X1 [Coccinella septempunctata]|uniref:uncharacterized protein LOC123312368 isoform X1 n=2 Tax=Coccinella septempunctata TaxID=41139 RepID=UPI001D090B1E|nr:uncharacterized protein LOC123312368 isoform X1 [Coccinella septempunctata]